MLIQQEGRALGRLIFECIGGSFFVSSRIRGSGLVISCGHFWTRVAEYAIV